MQLKSSKKNNLNRITSKKTTLVIYTARMEIYKNRFKIQLESSHIKSLDCLNPSLSETN